MRAKVGAGHLYDRYGLSQPMHYHSHNHHPLALLLAVALGRDGAARNDTENEKTGTKRAKG